MDTVPPKTFFVYQTVNIENGKRYIGCHETHDINDTYLGSGTLIKAAIKKYGRQAFHRSILEVCTTREQMFEREKWWIDLLRPQYNLLPGGNGGFHYINSNKLNLYKLKRSSAHKKVGSKLHKNGVIRYYSNPKKCKHCSDVLPYNKRSNRFCSSSCAASTNNMNRLCSLETRAKISSSLRANNGTRKRLCRECDTPVRAQNVTGYCIKHCQRQSMLHDVRGDIVKMLETMSYREVARQFGVSHVTIYNIVKKI